MKKIIAVGIIEEVYLEANFLKPAPLMSGRTKIKTQVCVIANQWGW